MEQQKELELLLDDYAVEIHKRGTNVYGAAPIGVFSVNHGGEFRFSYSHGEKAEKIIDALEEQLLHASAKNNWSSWLNSKVHLLKKFCTEPKNDYSFGNAAGYVATMLAGAALTGAGLLAMRNMYSLTREGIHPVQQGWVDSGLMFAGGVAFMVFSYAMLKREFARFCWNRENDLRKMTGGCSGESAGKELAKYHKGV